MYLIKFELDGNETNFGIAFEKDGILTFVEAIVTENDFDSISVIPFEKDTKFKS